MRIHPFLSLFEIFLLKSFLLLLTLCQCEPCVESWGLTFDWFKCEAAQMGIVWKFLPWVDPTSQTPTPTKCTNATLVYCTYCTFYPLSIGLFIGSKCFALTETGILHVYMTCFTCNEQQTCHLGKHFISDGKIYITFSPTQPRRSTLSQNSHQFHPPHPHLRAVTPS